MSEIDASPESLIIPENWNFPDRGKPGLKVLQIDPDQRFIAVRVPFDRSLAEGHPHVSHDIAEEDRDYIFSEDGSVLQRRSQNTRVIIDGGLTTISGIFGEGNLHYSFHRKTLKTVPDAFDLNVYFLRRGEERNLLESLAGVSYSRLGILGRLLLTEFFQDTGKQEEQIKSPNIILYDEYSSNAFLSPTLEGMKLAVQEGLFYPESHNLVEYKGGLPEFIILDEESSKELFKVESKVVDGAFVLKQTHLPSQIEKILEAPLRLDTIKVTQAAFSEAPYPKDEKGRLVVPWRDIPRIVGASLSYSYPPQNLARETS